ncbi:hypothetical protein BG004_000184, partial [Podila humilis]
MDNDQTSPSQCNSRALSRQPSAPLLAVNHGELGFVEEALRQQVQRTSFQRREQLMEAVDTVVQAYSTGREDDINFITEQYIMIKKQNLRLRQRLLRYESADQIDDVQGTAPSAAITVIDDNDSDSATKSTSSTPKIPTVSVPAPILSDANTMSDNKEDLDMKQIQDLRSDLHRASIHNQELMMQLQAVMAEKGALLTQVDLATKINTAWQSKYNLDSTVAKGKLQEYRQKQHSAEQKILVLEDTVKKYVRRDQDWRTRVKQLLYEKNAAMIATAAKPPTPTTTTFSTFPLPAVPGTLGMASAQVQFQNVPTATTTPASTSTSGFHFPAPQGPLVTSVPATMQGVSVPPTSYKALSPQRPQSPNRPTSRPQSPVQQSPQHIPQQAQLAQHQLRVLQEHNVLRQLQQQQLVQQHAQQQVQHQAQQQIQHQTQQQAQQQQHQHQEQQQHMELQLKFQRHQQMVRLQQQQQQQRTAHVLAQQSVQQSVQQPVQHFQGNTPHQVQTQMVHNQPPQQILVSGLSVRPQLQQHIFQNRTHQQHLQHQQQQGQAPQKHPHQMVQSQGPPQHTQLHQQHNQCEIIPQQHHDSQHNHQQQPYQSQLLQQHPHTQLPPEQQQVLQQILMQQQQKQHSSAILPTQVQHVVPQQQPVATQQQQPVATQQQQPVATQQQRPVATQQQGKPIGSANIELYVQKLPPQVQKSIRDLANGNLPTVGPTALPAIPPVESHHSHPAPSANVSVTPISLSGRQPPKHSEQSVLKAQSQAQAQPQGQPQALTRIMPPTLSQTAPPAQAQSDVAKTVELLSNSAKKNFQTDETSKFEIPVLQTTLGPIISMQAAALNHVQGSCIVQGTVTADIQASTPKRTLQQTTQEATKLQDLWRKLDSYRKILDDKLANLSESNRSVEEAREDFNSIKSTRARVLNSMNSCRQQLLELLSKTELPFQNSAPSSPMSATASEGTSSAAVTVELAAPSSIESQEKSLPKSLADHSTESRDKMPLEPPTETPVGTSIEPSTDKQAAVLKETTFEALDEPLAKTPTCEPMIMDAEAPRSSQKENGSEVCSKKKDNRTDTPDRLFEPATESPPVWVAGATTEPPVATVADSELVSTPNISNHRDLEAVIEPHVTSTVDGVDETIEQVASPRSKECDKISDPDSDLLDTSLAFSAMEIDTNMHEEVVEPSASEIPQSRDMVGAMDPEQAHDNGVTLPE